MSWLEKIIPPRIKKSAGPKKTIPDGVWVKCPECESVLYRADLELNLQVCPKCNYHLRISARKRAQHLLDNGDYKEIVKNISPVDFLNFNDLKKYSQRISEASSLTGESDALIIVVGKIMGIKVVVAIFEFDFMGGSMGSVVGEKFVRGAEYAMANKIPFLSVTSSGGARMQEGLVSLFQMVKTTSAIERLAEEKIPYISILGDPTMGGVSASFAFMADVIISEPKALIGFAGPRVIEQTVREKLPAGFQRAEFLLEKGAIDLIVDRRQMREKIGSLLSILINEKNSSLN
ncbi:MAG: acetyl-CoA carboxylase, carboxyltransferase subunit beta [Betaproteobacteria bacterium TMED82]|nr:MAG: acetyl-CoA carboxylase, carboxyltransferase subunit beta [Betaproteobacteria bacterium TMED82]|tara:strand:+ start:3033 stop:3902 length:870 start_codon:yes stop_codon:yes gene_type:complete